MSVLEQIFLTAVIAAFLFFGMILFSAYLWTGRGTTERKPRLKPLGLAAIALVVSLAWAAVIGQAVRQAVVAPGVPQLTAAR